MHNFAIWQPLKKIQNSEKKKKSGTRGITNLMGQLTPCMKYSQIYHNSNIF